MLLLVISFLDLELPVFDVFGRFVLGHRPAEHRYINRYSLKQRDGGMGNQLGHISMPSMHAAAPGRQKTNTEMERPLCTCLYEDKQRQGENK